MLISCLIWTQCGGVLYMCKCSHTGLSDILWQFPRFAQPPDAAAKKVACLPGQGRRACPPTQGGGHARLVRMEGMPT